MCVSKYRSYPEDKAKGFIEQGHNNRSPILIKFKAAVLLGVTVCASAGDQGSSDNEKDGKVHADFSSSSSFVLACGGTKISLVNGAIISKVVWHGSMSFAAGGVGQASVNKQ